LFSSALQASRLENEALQFRLQTLIQHTGTIIPTENKDFSFLEKVVVVIAAAAVVVVSLFLLGT
jgi:cell division protein FtsL